MAEQLAELNTNTQDIPTESTISILWGISNACKILRFGKLRILTISFNTNNANPTGGQSKKLAQLSADDYPTTTHEGRLTNSGSMNISVLTTGAVNVTCYSGVIAEGSYCVFAYTVA